MQCMIFMLPTVPGTLEERRHLRPIGMQGFLRLAFAVLGLAIAWPGGARAQGPAPPFEGIDAARRAVPALAHPNWAETAVTEIDPLYLRVLAVRERSRETEPERAAAAANNRAVAQEAAGDYAHAGPGFAAAFGLYENALAAVPTANLGLERNLALVASNLGVLYWKQGDAARAAQWLARAHEINERTLWFAFDGLTERQQTTAMAGIADETDALLSLHGGVARNDPLAARLALSILLQRKGRIADALTQRMADLHQRLAAGGQPPPRVPASMLERLGPRERETLDPSPAIDRRLLDALRDLNARLAHLSLIGPERAGAEGYRSAVQYIEAQQRELQWRIGQRLASFKHWEVAEHIKQAQSHAGVGQSGSGRARRHLSPDERVEAARIARAQVAAVLHAGDRPAALAEVQQAIPAGAALVELAVFRVYQPLQSTAAADPQARGNAVGWGPKRYAAYVLPVQGEPARVDLGDAAAIEHNVIELRRALSDPGTASAERAARALDEQVMRPVRRLLGDVRHVFLSLDGALNLIPFAALRDENHRYLVERFEFTYLTSGRDLIRLYKTGWERAHAARQPAALFGDADFGPMHGAAGTAPDAAARARRVRPAPRSFASVAGQFEALPGTVEEMRGIQAVWPDATVFTQQHASESALQQLHGPRIVHLATHGFFLEDPPASASAARAASGDVHPYLQAGLMHSGVLLAGANTVASSSGADDGVLTALEAAGLDLLGTQLVVLSACETGIGEVRNGEGVYGLRRAFAIAGAQTLVTSLWKVDDEATRDLMIDYYRRLRDGAGRSAALRGAQLKMRAEPGRSHPFFWAAFIPSGDWRKLD